MKGQRHERRDDDDVDGEFSFWPTKHSALRTGALIIMTV